MTVYTEENYFGGQIDVDGHMFEKCTFKDTVLRYSGGETPGFAHCHFDNCTLALDGAAANTISYLQAVHGGLGDWGRANVENLFRAMTGDSSGVQRPA